MHRAMARTVGACHASLNRPDPGPGNPKPHPTARPAELPASLPPYGARGARLGPLP